eukprot:1572834-Pleurochrysis_carterae.AAC.2
MTDGGADEHYALKQNWILHGTRQLRKGACAHAKKAKPSKEGRAAIEKRKKSHRKEEAKPSRRGSQVIEKRRRGKKATLQMCRCTAVGMELKFRRARAECVCARKT